VKVDFVDAVEFVEYFGRSYVILSVVFDLISHVLLVVGAVVKDLALEDVEQLCLTALAL
jgi:hypothetical protein